MRLLPVCHLKDCNCLQAIKKFKRSQVPLLQTYLLPTSFRPLWEQTVAKGGPKRQTCPQASRLCSDVCPFLQCHSLTREFSAKWGGDGAKVAVVGAKGTPWLLPISTLSPPSPLISLSPPHFTLSSFNLSATKSQASSNFGGPVRWVFCPNYGVLANCFVAMTRGNFRCAFCKCLFFHFVLLLWTFLFEYWLHFFMFCLMIIYWHFGSQVGGC